MDRSKIKLTILLSLIILLAFAFVACNGNENEKDNDNDLQPTAVPSPTEDPRVFKDTLPTVTPNENQHVTMVTTDDGYDVYAPPEGQWGYRYGPSIIYYPDGSIDAWFATPGTNGEWDWFTYKHSDDGGKTWTKEKVVLQPTPDSMDHYSVCDPGVIYINGWYYLGYTSTIVSTNGGINNNIFVARSQNPDGPYEKWNGSGWGGDPAPIIYYDESDSAWGAGEISFVEVNGVLYCYYTWTCPDGDFELVSTADANDENWPANLKYRGVAYKKDGGQDSCDVVYIEDAGKFVAFSTYQRFTSTSGIALMESNDGINFERVAIVKEGISQYCHNMGISKRPNGHIQLDDELCFVGYAYSAGDSSSGYWGKWATRFQNVDITLYEGEVQETVKGARPVYRVDYFWPKLTDETAFPIAVSTTPHKVEFKLSQSPYKLTVKWYDSELKGHNITSAEDIAKVKFSGYDTDMIEFDGLNVIAKKTGETVVFVEYEGLKVDFKIYVRAEEDKIAMENPAITDFRLVNENITMYEKIYYTEKKALRHKVQIRGYVEFEDNTWGEAYNDSTNAHPNYPAMVPIEVYKMTYESANTDIVRVDNKGNLTARGVGTTTVTVTMTDSTNGNTFTKVCNVTVLESLPAKID